MHVASILLVKVSFRRSDLIVSLLCVPNSGDGNGEPRGEVGEMPLGVCEAECSSDSGFSEPLSEVFVSEALRVSVAHPIPFLFLNLSSQVALYIFR